MRYHVDITTAIDSVPFQDYTSPSYLRLPWYDHIGALHQLTTFGTDILIQRRPIHASAHPVLQTLPPLNLSLFYSHKIVPIGFSCSAQMYLTPSRLGLRCHVTLTLTDNSEDINDVYGFCSEIALGSWQIS